MKISVYFYPTIKIRRRASGCLIAEIWTFMISKTRYFFLSIWLRFFYFFLLSQLHYSKNISLNKKVAIYKNILLAEKYHLWMYQLYYCICTYLICVCTYSCKWEISSGFYAVMIFQRRCHPDRLQRFKVMLRKTFKSKLCDSIRVMHTAKIFHGKLRIFKGVSFAQYLCKTPSIYSTFTNV